MRRGHPDEIHVATYRIKKLALFHLNREPNRIFNDVRR
jgi:hypothetical protein